MRRSDPNESYLLNTESMDDIVEDGANWFVLGFQFG